VSKCSISLIENLKNLYVTFATKNYTLLRLQQKFRLVTTVPRILRVGIPVHYTSCAILAVRKLHSHYSVTVVLVSPA